MAAIIAAIAGATALGIWAERRFGERAVAGSRQALMLVLWFVLPPVAFLNLVNADIGLDAGLGLVAAVMTLGVVGSIAWFVGARVLHLPRASTGALIAAVIVVNTGYLGYPVVAALVGFDALGRAVAYDIVVSGVGFLVGSFAVGAAFGEGAGETRRERVRAFFTRNPALAASALALVAPSSFAPETLVDISRIAIFAVLPIGFFAVGVTLAESAEEGETSFPPPFDRPIAVVVALRLLAAPLLLLGICAPFIDLPETYLLMAAMPCGLNTMIVSHAYGLDMRIAAGAITWSTVLAAGWLSVVAIA